jgi:ceroid-lipofuscinosis MFS transporter 7
MSGNGGECEDHDDYRILNDAPSKTVSFDLPSDYVVEKVNKNRGDSMHIHMGDEDHENNDKEDIDEQDVISVFSSVMTADCIADPTSFRINLFVIFLGDMGRGIFFPTMWNLVQIIGGNELDLGFLIGSFSFGRVLVLPMLGHLSNVYGTRFVNKITLLILASGSFLFSIVLNVRKMWFMLLANILIGIGSGNLGVTFSYASSVTPRRKRTSYLALCCAIQYAGTTGTPFIGSLFVWLFGEKDKKG